MQIFTRLITVRLFYSILVLGMALNFVNASEDTGFAACAKLQNDTERLHCFDSLSQKLKLNNDNQNAGTEFINPPREFMQAELRVRESGSDFTLTVGDFMNLVKSAVMENGKHIQVLGWTKSQDNFVLMLDMKSQLSLTFKYSADNTPKYCVLQPITNPKFQQDPAQFVMVIASMVPN